MANENNQAFKKVESFFRTSLKYYGKKIGLESNQHFSINQICDSDKEQAGEYEYVIQYGFPQSGSVSLTFDYSQEKNALTVNKVSVFAPPADKELIMANFAPQEQVGGIGIKVNFGIDMGIQEHNTLTKIEANPNAMKMLDIATLDLSQAQILGECRVAVPVGSKLIPCCDCTYMANTKGKSI